MAIRALNLHNTQTKSHPADKEDPTLWQIGVLDSRVLGIIEDKATSITIDNTDLDGETGVQMAANAVAYAIAQFGLRGFTNFTNDDGEVVFETERKVLGGKPYEVVKSSILETIPSDVVKWLASEVKALNTLTQSEGK